MMFKHEITIIQGIQQGDESKGKATAYLAATGEYDLCCRFAGSSNAGHTIYVNGAKKVTNQVPSGIFFNGRDAQPMTCIIASDCIDLTKLEAELVELEKEMPDVRSRVKIAENVHIITQKQIDFDKANNKVGTTGSGNGPCFADKMLRTGTRVDQLLKMAPDQIDEVDPRLVQHVSNGKVCGCEVIDVVSFFHNAPQSYKILCEGAQSYFLGINQKGYPFLTSSTCLPSLVCNMGLSHTEIKEVICIAKGYVTYVGLDTFQDMDDITLARYQEYGGEFGAITGRKRQTGYFDLRRTLTALRACGATKIIINKVDVMIEVNKKFGDPFRLIDTDGNKIEFGDFEYFKQYIEGEIHQKLPDFVEVVWSSSKYTI